MGNESYLIHLINPYNPDRLPRIFIRHKGESLSEISLESVLQHDQVIISYHLEDFFSLAPKGRPLFANKTEFIDICHAYRLIYGKAFKGKRGEEPWNIWNLINKKYGKAAYIKKLWEHIYVRKEKWNERDLLLNLNKFSILIEKIWGGILCNLKEKNEWDRFFLIEKPVNEVFLRRHLTGIKVSQENLIKRLDRLDEKISFAGRVLRQEYKIRDLKNSKEISRVLEKEGLGLLKKEDSGFDGILDLYAEHHKLAKFLKIYIDSKRDKDILLRLGAIKVDRIYPIYKCMGTITGRILVESPSLQHIKRINRDIIIADEGKVLLYPDYSQFEPGIMADQAGDEVLINGFNSGDLYKFLSLKLFGEEVKRKSAKILFLAFCYGMKFDRMIEFAAEGSNQNKDEVKKVIESFFGQYKTLINWRQQLENTLIKEKRIGTLMGNYRYRDFRSKQLAEVEKRWVISQRIQGTASLILKSVILEINQQFSDVEILLPVHDALLLQVPQDKKEKIKGEIEAVFIRKFVERCPSIRPRVSFSDFVEPDNEIEL